MRTMKAQHNLPVAEVLKRAMCPHYCRSMIGIFFLIIQLHAVTTQAAEFTVTSNADSGPGTLRDMLLQAAVNGSAEADVIKFNLPDHSESGRTITIFSQLPSVSSNLTIDGSTQPGAAFGVSTAKVKILTGFSSNSITNAYVLLLEDVKDVKIYGLYIKNELECIDDLNCYYRQGITVRNCRDIDIGAAGKGNVVLGFEYNIGMNRNTEGGQMQYHSVNVTLRATFISVEPDGNTLASVNPGTVIDFSYINGVVNIGGTPEEGNLFATGFSMYQVNTENDMDDDDSEIAERYSMPATIRFSNNKIGVNYSGTNTFPSFGVHFATHFPDGKNTIFIEDNIISSTTSYGLFLINNLEAINIRRNYIGTDRSLTQELPVGGTGIFVNSCKRVNIGSDDTADKNYIAHCKPIHVFPTSSVSVNKNSFFCVEEMFPMLYETEFGGSSLTPVVNILTINDTHVSGTGTPNAAIELFYADTCGTCAPETYFASTTVDAAGNWRYDGQIEGVVIASATRNGYTSEFTRTAIDVSQAKIENTCPIYGSITGIVPSSFTAIEWIDESGAVVATTADLLDVPPGKYKLKIGYGHCAAETPWYEIKPGITIDESAITVTDASCNAASGAIRGIKVANLSDTDVEYSWKDADGNEVGTALELTSVRPGSYALTISLADNSCTMSYGPVVVDNVSGPSLEESDVLVSATACGKAEGSVVGLRATGTGQVHYAWKNSDGEIVSGSLDLIGQPAGSYTLEVSDESTCGSIISSIIQIPETNGISLEDTGLVQDASCGVPNGAISGIRVSGATEYHWFDESGEKLMSAETPNLTDVPAGRYYLIATNSTCQQTSRLYTVGGGLAVAPPSASNLELCHGGYAQLAVNNVAAGYQYRLYDDAYGSIPLDEQSSGRFSIHVTENRSYYISQYIGDCESQRIQVDVNVGYAELDIPNTFSPNGDGINDTWNIKGIEKYPRASVIIFNRYGTRIFVSANYHTPFDGNMNGRPLPVGAYYYVINIGGQCGEISGSLTLLR